MHDPGLSRQLLFYLNILLVLANIFATPLLAFDLLDSTRARVELDEDGDAAGCLSAQRIRCGSFRLPSNACCLPTDLCWGLDNGSSALCCPAGGNCTAIHAVSCDILLQNPAVYPETDIMTTRLNDELPKCGPKCCPFGSICHENGTACIIDPSSSFLVNSSEVQGIPVLSSGLPLKVAPDGSAAGFAGTTDDKCDPFPGKAVVSGFFPGIVGGVLVTFLALYSVRWWTKSSAARKNRAVRASTSTTSSLSSLTVGPRPSTTTTAGGGSLVISGPISIPDSPSVRTEFLRRSDNSESRRPAGISGQREKSHSPPIPNSVRYTALQVPPAPSTSTIVNDPLPVSQRVGSAASVSVYTRPEHDAESYYSRRSTLSNMLVRTLHH